MDVICLGELLIDLIGSEASDLADVNTFKKYPGGAAGNVAVGVSKLGLKSGFIGKLGKDPFGDFLAQTIGNYGVDTTQICRDDVRKTGLAFVSLNEKGVPSYLFYRDPSASMTLKPEDVKEEYFKKGKAIYFSSMSLVNEPFRSANYEAINFAHKYGLLIAFDPNIRIRLWSSPEEAKQEIIKAIGHTNILKINKEELSFLVGDGDVEELCKKLIQKHRNLQLIALTLGEEGALIMNARGESVRVGANKVEVKDTTGAGDTYISALLCYVLKNNNYSDKDSLYKMGQYADAAATLTIMKRGVIPAMPTEKDVEEVLAKIQKNS